MDIMQSKSDVKVGIKDFGCTIYIFDSDLV